MITKLIFSSLFSLLCNQADENQISHLLPSHCGRS